MTLEDQAQLAERLLVLTQDMLQLAKARDWPALAVREEMRRELARDLFAQPIPPAHAATVADCVRQVLSVDQELIVLVEAGRDEAAAAMQEAQTGKKAMDTYRRFSR